MKSGSRKRSRPSTPLISSQIARRLAKLRERHRNLWEDDDDDHHEEIRSKKSRKSRVRVVLSDSEDDEEEEEENLRSQTKKRSKSKNIHCLICSILNQLSSENCCSKHLSLLKTPCSSTILPNHVMIIPLHDDLVHRYLDAEQIHRLKVKSSSIGIQTNATGKNDKSCQCDEHRASNSSISIEPMSSTEVILIDDSPVKSPWIPISDDVDAALEKILSHVEGEVFTPTTARHTDTDVMAARLPKIPLKQGRFRLGKPVPPPTTTAAADEYRPSNILTQDSATSSVQEENSQNGVSSNPSARLSYRRNPDGSCVRISRPRLSGSPSVQSLRRNSTDVTPKTM